MNMFENGLVRLSAERVLRSNATMGPKEEGVKIPKWRLGLFTKEWMELQTKTALISRIPATEVEFEQRYGKISGVDRKTIQNAIEANAAIRALADDFGSPSTLLPRFNEKFFSTNESPSEIYAHIVWLTNRINRNAKLFQSRIKLTEKLIDPRHRRRAEERRDALLDIMTGQFGMIPAAAALENDTRELCDKLRKFIDKIAESKKKFDAYQSARTSILASVDAEVKKIQSQIDTKFRPAEKSYNYWFWGAVILAAIAVVAVVVLSCGAAGPLVAGGALTLAGKAAVGGAIVGVSTTVAAVGFRSAYNDAAREIATLDEQKRKQNDLSFDLSGLGDHVDQIAPAVTSVHRGAENMKETWSNISEALIGIKEDFTTENLKKQPAASVIANLRALERSWGQVADAAEDFTGTSLVQYTYVRMGDPLPAAQTAA